jgi:hypothetical protein
MNSNHETFSEEKEDYSTNIVITDPLLEPFFVVKDSHCYTLHMKTKTNPNYTVDGTSKETVKTMGHFADLPHCLKKITAHKVHFKKEYSTIKEYINEYNKIKQDTENFLKSFLDEK